MQKIFLFLVLCPLVSFASIDNAENEESFAINYSVVGNYLAGDYAIRNKDPKAASEIFLDAIGKDPDNPVLLRGGFKLMLSNGEVRKAAEIAYKYTAKYGMSSPSALLLAAYAAKKGDFVKAEDILNKIGTYNKGTIEESINAVVVPLAKLWVMAGREEGEEALAAIDELKKEDKLPELFLDYQDALLSDLAGDIDRAQKAYDAILKGNVVIPHHFAKTAGNFYERTGNSIKAKEIYEKYNKQHVSFEGFKEPLKNISRGRLADERVIENAEHGLSEVFREAVRVLYSGSYYTEALPYLRLAMHLNENDENYVLLARYFSSMQKYEDSIDAYEEVNSSSDFYLSAQIAIAEDLYKMKEESDSIKKLKRLHKRYPESEVVTLTLADILRKSEKYEAAAKVYGTLIKGLKDPDIKRWPVYFARGICYERAKKWELAEPDFLQALRLKPNQPDVLNYLGYSWIDRNINIEKAKQMVEAAVKARPNDAQMIDSMGWVLYKTNEFAEASKLLERAAEITPYDAVINDHLGDSYWREGRYNEAVFQWQRALKYKNSEDVSENTLKDKIKNGLPSEG